MKILCITDPLTHPPIDTTVEMYNLLAEDPRRGISTIRSKSWTGRHGFAAMLRAVRAAVSRGTLIPLSLYDPDACEMGGTARIGGLLLGASRAEVEEEDRRLAVEGLD